VLVSFIVLLLVLRKPTSIHGRVLPPFGFRRGRGVG
jgi:hypothetical protein